MPLNVDLEYVTKKAEKLAKTLPECKRIELLNGVNQWKEFYAQQIKKLLDCYTKHQPQPLDPSEVVE
mgnify:CR=1 FL=1